MDRPDRLEKASGNEALEANERRNIAKMEGAGDVNQLSCFDVSTI